MLTGRIDCLAMSSMTAGQHIWRRQRSGLPVLTWSAFDGFDLDAFVTTRDGGASSGPYSSLNLGLHVGDDPESVVRNRGLVAEALDATLDDMVFCQQSHEASVEVIENTERGRGARSESDAIQRTDALVTIVPGIVLVVLVADCVPLVLHDPVAGVLACVHAGWRGTVRGVTTAAVAAMRDLGSEPADIVAGVGPSIAPDRYQVGEDVREAATGAFGDDVDQVLRPDGTGRWNFDLWRANTLQLMAAGVPEEQVHVTGLDTGPGTPFFSHRAQNPCGRFAAVARLRERQSR